MGRNPQLDLLPEKPAEQQPVEISDICTKCGRSRDRALVALMQTILRLRARLAKIDPEAPLL